MTVRIGIGGPIGCGKSTVAGWLGDLGATVVDADELARDVTVAGRTGGRRDPRPVRIRRRRRRPVGSTGRPWRRSSSPTRRRCAISRRSSIPPSGAGSRPPSRRPSGRGAPAVVVEAIRLAESGLAALCDEVWSVECSPADQRSRLIGRGMAEEDIERRMAAQGDLSAPPAPDRDPHRRRERRARGRPRPGRDRLRRGARAGTPSAPPRRETCAGSRRPSAAGRLGGVRAGRRRRRPDGPGTGVGNGVGAGPLGTPLPAG